MGPLRFRSMALRPTLCLVLVCLVAIPTSANHYAENCDEWGRPSVQACQDAETWGDAELSVLVHECAYHHRPARCWPPGGNEPILLEVDACAPEPGQLTIVKARTWAGFIPTADPTNDDLEVITRELVATEDPTCAYGVHYMDASSTGLADYPSIWIPEEGRPSPVIGLEECLRVVATLSTQSGDHGAVAYGRGCTSDGNAY